MAGARARGAPAIGTNKTYADRYDARSTVRMYERIVAAGAKPITLSPQEIDLEHQAVTTPARRPKVIAWVRYGNDPIRVRGEIHKWTDDAVAIVWKIPSGEQHHAWIWRGAVIEVLPEERNREFRPVLGDEIT